MKMCLTLICLVLAVSAWAEPARVTETELRASVTENRARVAEFEQIARLAKERGLKAYLFGGTAATYVHYVRADLLRKKNDPAFQSARQDYDLTTMFRGTQDLDIVVTRADGTAETEEEIKSFGREVQKKVSPHRGRSASWEIRGLKTSSGTKSALVGDPDFHRQNTDSQSTALVELTTPAGSAVTDLRGGNFLADAAAGKIHYLVSPSHNATRRAKEGDNPEILSALRCLSKSFQFGLELDPADEAAIRSRIDAFNPAAELTSYARKRLTFEGTKLVLHARNLDDAMRTIDRYGLRQKLAALDGNSKKEGSLGWLMIKSSLPRQGAPGTGNFTAGQLGITKVAHATSSFDAFLSLTGSPDGIPNAFISRSGAARGEEAWFGEGFYTLEGERGMSRRLLKSYHIVFNVNPNAVEGVDFSRKNGEVIWHNARFLTVDTAAAHPLRYKESMCMNLLRGLGVGGSRLATAKDHAALMLTKPLVFIFTAGALSLGATWLITDGWNLVSGRTSRMEKWKKCAAAGGANQDDGTCLCQKLKVTVQPPESCNDPKLALRIFDERLAALEAEIEPVRVALAAKKITKALPGWMFSDSGVVEEKRRLRTLRESLSRLSTIDDVSLMYIDDLEYEANLLRAAVK